MKSSELDIAILRTDEVLPDFVGVHGDYPEMFESLLRAGARDREEPVPLKIHTYDARHCEFPEPGAHQGYLITGSRKSVYDEEAWIGALAGFLRAVLRAGSKVVGICFGHQLLAHFFGGRTEPAPGGWLVGVQENHTTSREPWMDGTGNRLNLIASHRDQVTQLPPGARLIAASDNCPLGGFVMGKQVLTFQGHPEFQRAYSRALMEMRREAIGEDTYRAGVESLEKETDEALVGRWIINFFIDDGH